MQSNSRTKEGSVPPQTFSSYLSKSADVSPSRTNFAVGSTPTGSQWTNGGDLPPPPLSCEEELTIQPKSIPTEPAKLWDLDASDDDLSDEGIGKARMELHTQVSDSGSDGHDSESECTTEIYVPKTNMVSKTLGAHRRPGAAANHVQYSTLGRGQGDRGCEVIPSVSNDNIWLCSPNKAPHTDIQTEEIATNIDSGISNETSQLQSHDGATVIHRTMSVSSSSHYSSSYSCGSRGEIPSPKIGQRTRRDDIAVYMRVAKTSRVVNFLSAAYGLMLVLLGIIFSIINNSRLNKDVLEGYYIFLYGLGLLFLIYAYATVARTGSDRPSYYNNSHRFGPIPHHCRYAHSGNPSTVGNLFLRVTAVLLCAGAVIDSGLKFGVYMGDDCTVSFLTTITPLIQAVFILFEVYFVFNNEKMCTRLYPIKAKFGIIHLMATNVSVWILRVWMQSSIDLSDTSIFPSEINATSQIYLSSNQDSQNTMPTLEVDTVRVNCTQNEFITELAEKVNPYSYPCTVQFCVLVTCILYVVWKKMDLDSDTQCSECKELSKRISHNSTRTIDCGSTSRGLFLGVLVLVTTIGVLIAFFMLTTENYYDVRATLAVAIYRIATYLLMTIISVVVLLKLRNIDYNACKPTHLEDILSIICAIGLLTLDIIGMLAGVFSLTQIQGLLSLAVSTAEIVQSAVQMAAIVMGLKLGTPEFSERLDQDPKPGRECVTFLAIANIALWLLSIFNNVTAQGYQVQVMLVGQLPWNYLISIINPIVMFYHLFSASCFIDIWYNAYRKPNMPVANI